MSRRTTAWWRSDLTYAERLCDGGFVRSNSRSRSPSTFMVVAFILNLYQNECAKQAVIVRSDAAGTHLGMSARVGGPAGAGHSGRRGELRDGDDFTLELPLDSRPHQPGSDEQPEVHEEIARSLGIH